VFHTDVTIIETEIKIVILTENQIQLKKNFFFKIFVHPIKRSVQCIAGQLIDAISLQQIKTTQVQTLSPVLIKQSLFHAIFI